MDVVGFVLVICRGGGDSGVTAFRFGAMGASRAVDVSKENLQDVMNSLGMTEGFDVGLEMSGVPVALRDMLNKMNHGGKVAMLGIPPSDVAIDWNQVIFKGLVIKGIYGREMFETWYKMASLLQSGSKIDASSSLML